MKAWQIFTHSVRQVFGNLQAALRVSWAIFLAEMALSVLFGASGFSMPLSAQSAPADMLLTGLMACALLLGSLWIAVAWHRYVLLVEEPQRLLPPFHGRPMLDYLLKSLGIALVIVLIGVVMSLLSALLLVPLLGPLAGSLSIFAVLIPCLVVGYRFSAILPAAALGRPIRFTAGWEATVGESGVMFGLAAISTFATLLLSLPGLILGPIPVLGLLWELASGWVQLMVGISMLTTLYGHYIEKRALV